MPNEERVQIAAALPCTVERLNPRAWGDMRCGRTRLLALVLIVDVADDVAACLISISYPPRL